MTAEMGERTGNSQVSKIEIEEKISSNLSSCEDLGKVGGDCNGIVHHCVETTDSYVKDGGDGSYVFVGGPDAVSDDLVERDLDAECVADPTETLETMPAVEDEAVSEPNVDSPSGEKQVEVGELSIEKVGNDQFPVENGCNIDESVVSSSNNSAAVESSHCQPKGNEVEKNDPADEQNKTALAPYVEGDQESIITATKAAESEVALLDRDDVKENVTVPLAEVESDEVDQSQEPITVKESVECELQQLDYEEKIEESVECELQQLDYKEKIEEPDSVKETAEQSKLDSVTKVQQNEESENMVEDSAESKRHQLHNGEDEGGELKILDLAIKKENQDSQVNGEKVEEFDGVEETEEQSKLDSATEVKENQEFENVVDDSTESKRHLLHDGEDGGELRILDLAIRKQNQDSQVNEKKVEDSDGVEETEEQSKLDSVTEVKENQESENMVEDSAECKRHQLCDGEEDGGEPRILELAVKKENQDPQVNGEKVEESDGVEETEEQSKLDSVTEIKENQESENVAEDSAESKRHQLHDGEKDGAVSRTLNLAKMNENQDSQVKDMKDVELELGQLDNGEEKDPEDNLSGLIRLEAASGPVIAQLHEGALNGSIENGMSLASGTVALETEAVNDLALGNRNMCSADIKQESENVDDGSSLPHLVDEVGRETEVGNISVEDGESFPTEPVYNVILEGEDRNPRVEISESLPLKEGTKLETVVASGSTDGVEGRYNCIAANGKLENEICNGSVEGDIVVPTCPAENLEIKSEAGNGSAASSRSLPNCSVDDVEVDSESLNCPVKNGSSLPTCHIADVEQEPEAGNGSGACGNAVNLGAIVQDGSVENGGTTAHLVKDIIDVENEGTQSTGADSDDKPICQEAEGIQGDKHKVDTEVVKKPFHFLIKIPRYVDDKLKEQIRLAQLQVEEKTQSRDAIRATIQTKRPTCNEYRDKFEAARSEERIARDAFSAKRQEIDSVQSAISVDDIDDRIHNMEHMIQHETMPLKEEKQLIREIKQMKLLREQLSSHMGRQDEHHQASDQRDNHEERFKLLKQELDSLRKKVLQTEGITKTAKEKYFEENEKLRNLQSQFKAADDLRQEAYAHLQNLRKELYEKNNYFRMYKDEQRVANDYASAGDREALQRLCVNQVETVMELWNKNEDFRKEYVRCNTISTLRRLTTLDGRSLGPDEEPPVIHLVDERVDNAASSHINSALVISPSEPEKSFVLRVPEKEDDKSVVRVQQENATVKSKQASKPTALENGSAMFSGREERNEVEEENKKSKEEEELARKAEELRKEEAAARLKEQRRLDEKVKAKEAEERKRRNAEKAQARAELRAQREAELKEKEREKRAKKKERKKAAAAKGADVGAEGESAPSTENTPSETTAHESEIKEKNAPVVNRPQKPFPPAKQSKTKPLPPPLRNRGKRRMQTWMWFAIVTLFVLALFFLGSVGISFKFGLPSFGF